MWAEASGASTPSDSSRIAASTGEVLRTDLATVVVSIAVAGGCGASLVARPSNYWTLACAIAALAVAMICLKGVRVRRTRRIERAAMAGAVVLYFVPCLWFAVAPGADMTMHAALARAVVDGGSRLSPAYGDFSVAAYPRGLSLWIGLLAPLLGYAKAGLVVACAVFALFALALRAYARDALALPDATFIALLAAFGSKAPQGFFNWGGVPNALALVLGLVAGATIAAMSSARPVVCGMLAAVLLIGAAATHPMGSLGAAGFVALAAALVVLRSHRDTRASAARSASIATAIALAAWGLAMLWFAAKGPGFSPAERSWLLEFERPDALGGPYAFPAGIFRFLFDECGPLWLALWIGASLYCARDRAGRRVVWASLAAVEIFAASFAYGARLPGIGVLLFPARFVIFAVLAMMPPIAAAAQRLRATPLRLGAMAVIAFSLALGVHIDLYQLTEPIATHNDVLAIECLERSLPRDAVIVGRYGDATSWIPALAGHPVVHSHVHCTLFDETRSWFAGLRPGYHFVGERTRYPDSPADGATSDARTAHRSGAPFCQFGSAAVYRITDD